MARKRMAAIIMKTFFSDADEEYEFIFCIVDLLNCTKKKRIKNFQKKKVLFTLAPGVNLIKLFGHKSTNNYL